ncbi:MAG: VWA domain-containing protein [Devosia sp.]|nr:VWA domain-containing protein [Devosia sp.]
MLTPALAADRAIIILDASGSMWAQVDGQSRIDIARQTLAQVLKGVPGSLELGLMAYGHRSKGDCNDIELLVPPAAGTTAAISAAAARLAPKGKTPLTAAVRQAAETLKYTEDKATVILITDGIETCDADPCALGNELRQNGVGLTVDVVGFGLSASEGKQVACLADNTGGRYFDARNAKGLSDALTKTVAEVAKPAPQPAPEEPAAAPGGVTLAPQLTLSAGGPGITDDGPRWDLFAVKPDGTQGNTLDTTYGAPGAFKLAPGDYYLQASWDEAKSPAQKVTLPKGGIAKPVFDLNAGILVLHPRPAPSLEVEDGAAVEIDYPGGNTTRYGNVGVKVPAGDEKVKVTLDAASTAVDVPLAAGQTVEQDIVIGAGHVTANASYAEGGDKVTDGGLTFAVKGAKQQIDGSRTDFGTNYGPDTKRWLAAGDYVMDVMMDQAHVEVPFTVKVGEETDVEVVLNAGVAAITAPGAQRIVVHGAKKDINGKVQEFSSAYAAMLETTLPAGDYIAIAVIDDTGTTKDAPFTVKAGERTETAVATGL